MKTLKKFTLAVAIVVMGVASAAAQTFLEDPKYGDTPDERKTNVGKLNFLSDAVAAKSWALASGYIRDLMNDAPAASQALYQHGTNTYKNLAARATSVAQKKVYVDSVMLIYDRRVEYFGNNQSTPALQLKARDYAALNPMDREGVRRYYKEAVDASGAAVKSSFVLEYFQQLVTDYKGQQITAEALLAAYEELLPLMENAPAEDKDTFTALFATSGAADCGVLEGLYTKELAAKPGDVDVLAKAYGLMSLAGCETDFYISVAEQYYAAKPSSEVAIRLATMLEMKKEYEKALKYLNESLATETDPIEKAKLYVRMAASELELKRNSDAAQSARQVIALNPADALGHMLLAEAYIGGASNCSGFHAQTVFWLAYDELVRARDLLSGAEQEATVTRMANVRANFPTKEDAFMYINGYQDGQSYTVSCGWVSGVTTTRSR
jgi:tetratricopeptide (TPR) repeat protein